MRQFRIALAKAVNDTKKVDMTVENFLVGDVKKFNSYEVEYELTDYLVETAQFKSFSETAEVIERDGTKVVRLKPFEISRGISKNVLNIYERNIGMHEFANPSQAKINATAQAINEKIHSGALVRRKLLMSSILSNLVLTTANDSISADFGINIAAHRVVKATGLWNAPNAPVVADLANIRKKSRGSVYIMNSNTYSNMLSNGDLKVGFDTTGKGLNFKLNENADASKEFYRAGKVLDATAMGDVYIWDSNDDAVTQYIADGVVVCTRPKILRAMFAGLPYRPVGGELTTEVAEWNVMREQSNNPPFDGIIYRSAPMYAPLSTWKISTLKAY